MRFMRRSVIFAAVFLMAGIVSASPAREADIRFLQQGVQTIGSPGAPGPVCVFGDRSFAVVTGRRQEAQIPVVAAAEYGRGRGVAFGHEGYLNPETLEKADTLQFLLNCIQWVANAEKAPAIGVFRNSQLVSYLSARGPHVVDTDLQNLASIDVLISDGGQIASHHEKPLQDFVANGGGLITGTPGWGWKQLHPGKSLMTDFPANRLLLPMGLFLGDGSAEKNSPDGYRIEPFNPDYLNAAGAWEAVLADTGKYSPDVIQQLSVTLTLAIRTLPNDETNLMPKIRSMENRLSEADLPNPHHPVKTDDIFRRILTARHVLEVQNQAPAEITASGSARFFPGQVSSDAARVRKTVLIDTSVPRWHSTGLYAAAGEKIRIHGPAAVGRNLKVRIGSHTDCIWDHAQWKRCPEISRSFTIVEPVTIAASAFGGLVYIEVPDNSVPETIDLAIDGAVEAPLYVQGRTSLQDWKDKIRHTPGPWAELATDKVIITVPSANIRDLDDPAALMTVWDAILDACADLATMDRVRKSPERIVPDVQISAGYMHAGYPIMVHDDQYANLVNRAHLLEGNWGFFHELGHNHQSPDWTFDGTTEVTVNLFTTYVYDQVCGVSPAQGRVNLHQRLQDYERYVAGGRNFEQWKTDPFLALVMYLQLQERFGWDVYKKVFAEYRGLPDSERPRSDTDKRDQWMVRFARAAGCNLGPFFDMWNVPVSETAKNRVESLPVWLPEDFKAAKALSAAK